MLRIPKPKFIKKQGLLGLSLLLSVLSFAPSALARLEKSDEVYWQEAGMNLDILFSPDFITRENCHLSFVLFQGCYDALNTVANKGKPPYEVLPKSVLNRPSFVAGPVRDRLTDDFVLADLLQSAEEKKSLRLATQESALRDQAISAELEQIFSVSMMGPIDFPFLIEKQIEISKISEDRKPMVIAQAMTAFVKVAVDAHARVEPQQKLDDRIDNPNIEVIGIGAQLESLNDQIVVVTSVEGSTAESAGILPNDIIESIDGKPVMGMPLQSVVNMIRGRDGTSLKLILKRAGRPIEVTVLRAKVSVPNIVVKTQDIFGQKFAVVKISTFSDKHACNQIENDLLTQMNQHSDLAGVIIDVRSNPGGLLQQAVCIGSLFVGQIIIAKTKDLGAKTFEEYVGSRRAITDLPVATLINAGSASASEVLSGALQDYKRSWVVGDRSFGKGTVQEARRINSKIRLYRTIGRFYQPSERTNQIVGITPDFQSFETPNPTDEEKFSVREKTAFPNALPNDGKQWVQTRNAEVARIANCRSQSQKAEAAFATDSKADYQMMVAAEVLGCDPVKKVQLP